MKHRKKVVKNSQGLRAEIYQGDCLDVLPTLKANSLDAIVCDPPYCSGGRQTNAARSTISKSERSDPDWFQGDNMGSDTYWRWMRIVAADCIFTVRDGGHAYVFGDWRQYNTTVTAWESSGWTLKNCIVWDKAKGGAMGSFWRNNHEWCAVFAKGKGKIARGVHPTIKPLGLMSYIVSAIPKITGVICDPFAGSGTTLLAAWENGFNVIGIERDTRYVELIKERLEAGK